MNYDPRFAMMQPGLAVGMPPANGGNFANFPAANAGMGVPQAVPGMAPGLVVPPAMVASQVWAGNQTCPVPAIAVNQQPACPDPSNSLQLTKRVFTTVASGLFVADNGEQLQAGFSLSAPGLVAGVPEAGSFAVRTNATTTGVIRDITIAVDPFSIDYVAFQISIPEVINSYGLSFSALLAGQITVDNVPFATVIPIASAIKNVGGVRSYWTTQSATAGDILYVSAVMESTHSHAPAPIEIHLPASSEFGVFIDVPSRNINDGPYTALINAVLVNATFVWTGLLTVLQENNTSLGALGIG